MQLPSARVKLRRPTKNAPRPGGWRGAKVVGLSVQLAQLRDLYDAKTDCSGQAQIRAPEWKKHDLTINAYQ